MVKPIKDTTYWQAEVHRYRTQMEISDIERKDAQEDFEHAAHKHGVALEALNKLQQKTRRSDDETEK